MAEKRLDNPPLPAWEPERRAFQEARQVLELSRNRVTDNGMKML
jgi:hypothetical protein